MSTASRIGGGERGGTKTVSSRPTKAAKKVAKTRGSRSRRSAAPVEVSGEARRIALADLKFDPRNPRLPEGSENKSQEELLEYIARQYEPIEVARSIAAHGYFLSEPLIVVMKSGAPTVVEGNRRLAALKLLASPGRAVELELPDADEWSRIASETKQIPTKIPVVVAPSRAQVAPIIGYRHISGIEPWDPWAKARFLATMVDTTGLSFEEAATQVGEAVRDVRAHYRNYRVTRQARDDFGLDTSRAEKRFGVFTRAMQDKRILRYVGAPVSADVVASQKPLRKTAKKPVSEVLSWIFGDAEQVPLFTDSRRITDLGTVLASKDGVALLRERRDLDEAFAAAGGIKERLLHRIDKAVEVLLAAQADAADYTGDDEVRERVSRCEDVLAELRQIVDG